MRRRNSRQDQAWIVLLTAILWMAIGLARGGVPSSGPIAAEEGGQQGQVSGQARRLPDDLVAVADAQRASLDGLAPGSLEAQERQRQAVPQLGLPLEVKTAKTGIVLRLVPAGRFTMGSPRTEQDAMVRAGVPRGVVEDEVEHEVTLSKAFYCGKFEVTQGQWEQVMGTSPSYFMNAGKDAPVEQVTWLDCEAFVRKLCQMEQVAEGTYRLLTEGEWEYACRAGTQTALYNGDLVIKGLRDAPALDGISWYGGNSGVEYAGGSDSTGWREKQYNHSRAGTHVVGAKRANAFGLHDMIGNVWEWCGDWYGQYSGGPVTDPLGPVSGVVRVLRGGGWYYSAGFCRSAFRDWFMPVNRGFNLGLRLARKMPSYP